MNVLNITKVSRPATLQTPVGMPPPLILPSVSFGFLRERYNYVSCHIQAKPLIVGAPSTVAYPTLTMTKSGPATDKALDDFHGLMIFLCRSVFVLSSFFAIFFF